MQVLEQFSGPIPPPALLQQYNEVVPNGAERILKAFEDQTRHRQELERTVVAGNDARATRGQWMALFIALAVLALGAVFTFTGHDAVGIATIGIDVVGLRR